MLFLYSVIVATHLASHSHISLDVTTFSILVNEGFFASIKFNAPIISHIVSLKLSVLLPMSFFHLILLDNIVDYRPVVLLTLTLREKCPNTELFLVSIFPYLDTFHAV